MGPNKIREKDLPSIILHKIPAKFAIHIFLSDATGRGFN